MPTTLWNRLLDLPLRTKLLAGAGVLAVLVLVVLLVTGGEEADLGVAATESGAPVEQPAQPATPATPGEIVAQPATPGDVAGAGTGTGGGGVAPINAQDSGGDVVRTIDDARIEAEMNATLPKEGRTATPDEIAEQAPADVKLVGRSLAEWSSTLRACLEKDIDAPLSCKFQADEAVPGIEYLDGMLVGDVGTEVTFEIFRATSGGTRVWLLFNNGAECHGYGSEFSKCSAW
jgi:hypothetical protein